MIENASPGLWALAWRRLRADRIAMGALAVVLLFLLSVLLSSTGLVAADWEDEVAVNYAPPSFVGPDPALAALARPPAPVPPNAFDPLAADLSALKAELAQKGHAAQAVKAATLPFGADKWGHDILKKTIKGGQTSIVVGLVAALVAVALGTLFGAISGFYGGKVDDLFNWFYSIFTSIPSILMILTVAAVLQTRGVLTIVLILGLTGWTGPYRLIRAEYIKHKAREYVMAADAIGASGWRRMFSHILPNVSHVALVQMSILVVGFIKAEVILSFLGFGVPVGTVSWGSMLNEAQNELILGKWWQLAAAASAMAMLVTAFSLFADALRDALDPKLK
ncbi:ABC transporter permease [Massilia norwichensis]|uniref:ABC transporter permease n=2 Tax=Massilia norwichensis TaxID=1442366 RepID=A0ABT2ACZ7_9BURK|nr:ABC transporter permease [Massilia norwichensis]MCS0592027.1 ABC transporter permease [Massilia norwichensis]